MSIQVKSSWGFYLAIIPPTLLAIDMVYENTALSWEGGPQMIGFTLMHTVGIILLPAHPGFDGLVRNDAACAALHQEVEPRQHCRHRHDRRSSGGCVAVLRVLGQAVRRAHI